MTSVKPEIVEIDRGGWISGPCDIPVEPSGDAVEDLADEIVLEVRKILGRYRRAEMDEENARRLMRKNVMAVCLT